MTINRDEQSEIIIEKLKNYKKRDKAIADTKDSIDDVFIPPLMHENPWNEKWKKDSSRSEVDNSFIKILRKESNPEGKHVESIEEIKTRLNPKGLSFWSDINALKDNLTS